MNINVIIADKHALAMPHEPLVCGNNDYVIEFQFDEEWDAHPTKTARFIFDDRKYIDVVFHDNLCPVPVLSNTHEVLVGVFAGNLVTTTPAYLRSQRSVLCYGGEKTEITQDVYDQIMQYVNEAEYRVKLDAQTASEKAQEAIDSASAAHASEENADASEEKAGESERAAASHASSASEHARNAEASATVASEKATAAEESATRAVTSENNAKASRTAADESAQNASESARAADKSASDAAASAQEARQSVDAIPGALPNPNKLTLTGGAVAEYDGSSAVSVEVPNAFVVKVGADKKCSHTRQEIVGAVSTGKACMLVYYNGQNYQYSGLTTHNGVGTIPVFRSLNQASGGRWFSYKVLVLDDYETYFEGDAMSVRNPNSLRFTGAVDATYNGSEGVTVNIPAGAKLKVDADGNATI